MPYGLPQDPDAPDNRVVCPRCSEPIIRVRRRPIDHLISLFISVQRYRCRNHSCQWEGSIRASKLAQKKDEPTAR